MVCQNGIRAFADPKYDYYELTQNLGGVVPCGAIFVHDYEDDDIGSPAEGCLKLCWTKEGNCYGVCANTVFLHASFIRSPMFKLVKKGTHSEQSELIRELERLEAKHEELVKEIQSIRLKLSDS